LANKLWGYYSNIAVHQKSHQQLTTDLKVQWELAISAFKKMEKQIRIGMVGGGAIAKAHVLAYQSVPLLHSLENVKPVFTLIADATKDLASQAASRLGFEDSLSDWKSLASSPNVDLVDIVAPTFLHVDVAIEAAEHHKHILCEKPIAASSIDAKRMYEAATRAGVVNAMGFNYRRLPAVLLAKKIIESGRLGKITQFRTSFMEDWAANPNMPFTWRYNSQTSGGGAIADLGSHIIDISRFLVGDIRSVCGMQDTFITERKLAGTPSKSGTVDVDDYSCALIRFTNGVPGRLETSWASLGRKVYLDFEVNGTEGSVYFNFEKPNELSYYSDSDPKDLQGHRAILMGPVHPYGTSFSFPATGSGAGFQDSLNNEIYEVLNGVINSSLVKPDFYDGWKVSQVVEAIHKSSIMQKWVEIE
jgi:predicted dehydrogenase